MRTQHYVSAIVFVVLLAALAWVNNDARAPFLALILAFGAVGAVLREQVHLRKKKDAEDASATIAWFYPVMGSLVAVVLMTLFLSGLVSGALFPRFLNMDGKFDGAYAALRGGMTLASQADFYKMIAWSILAGYSERFVLAKLEALTSAAKKERLSDPNDG